MQRQVRPSQSKRQLRQDHGGEPLNDIRQHQFEGPDIRRASGLHEPSAKREQCLFHR